MTWSSNRKKGTRRKTRAPINPAQTVMDFTDSAEVVEAEATGTLPTKASEVDLRPGEGVVLVMEKRSWTGAMTRAHVQLQGEVSVRQGKELLQGLGAAMAMINAAPLTKGSHGMLADLAHAAFWHHAYALLVLPMLHGPGMALLAFVTGQW